MFTFGREHEKKCSVEYLHNVSETDLIHGVIDAVHDLLDGIKTSREVASIISDAFLNGGGGVWEQTGTWILRIAREHPSLNDLWISFASHPSYEVRFRAAAHTRGLPSDVFTVVFPRLLGDESKKVRLKVAGDIAVSPRTDAEKALICRRSVEEDPSVIESIDWAIESIRQLASS